MRRSFYDVVVLGGALPSLAAGALLARRGFRVTVVGHGALAGSYTHDGLTLRRTLTSVCVTDTPAFRRVFAELALLPAARRRVTPLAPAWQAVMPRHRVDVHAASEPMLAEFVREFPELQRPMEDFALAAERANAAADALFGEDLRWPPQGFWERRTAQKHLRGTGFGDEPESGDILSEFAPTHPFRVTMEAQLRAQSALDPSQLSPFARARLHGLGLRAATLADGDLDGLRAMLEEKVQQHGGDLRLRDRADRVVTRGGGVTAVRLAGTDEEIGCAFVVSSLEAVELLRLAGETAPRAIAARLQGTTPAFYRYVLNAALPAEAVPVGMGRRVFAVASPLRPLVEENLVALELGPADGHGRVVLTASALLPRTSVEEGSAYLEQVRERVLQRVREVVPFFDRNVLLIDSPHDGLPAFQRDPSRSELRRAGGPEAMEPVEHHPSLDSLRLFGLPWRTPIGGVFTVNRQNAPALGLEGELLVALTVAREITRTDRSKERMRRELWSKVET